MEPLDETTACVCSACGRQVDGEHECKPQDKPRESRLYSTVFSMLRQRMVRTLAMRRRGR